MSDPTLLENETNKKFFLFIDEKQIKMQLVYWSLLEKKCQLPSLKTQENQVVSFSHAIKIG